MAVAIDTAFLAERFIHGLQRAVDGAAGSVRRFQVHRVCANTTVVFDDSAYWQRLEPFCRTQENFHEYLVAKGNALAWQPDPDDDVHESEVFRHLQQQAATTPLFSDLFSQKDHTNDAVTLVANAVSPSFSTMTHGRLPSSFHRYSLRSSEFFYPAYFNRAYFKITMDNIAKQSIITPVDYLDDVRPSSIYTRKTVGCVCDVVDDPWFTLEPYRNLEIVWDSSRRGDRFVLCQVQVDIVDLFSRRTHPCSRPGKRRRSAFNPFLKVFDSPVVEDTSGRNHRPHTKRFNGVRYRPDRRTWVAEMTPPKHKKQYFGNFKSEAQAARAVDAAFHHYGKPHLLNFPDSSPNILSTRPPAPSGLDDTTKLRFVTQEAKWLATMATNSSALPDSLLLQSSEPSPSCTAHPSGQFRSFSEISWPLSCASPHEADDAVSQWMQLPPFPDIAAVAVQSMEPPLGGSSVEITELVGDDADDCEILAAPRDVVSPRACEMQSMWLDSLIRSPPAPTYCMAPSPSHSEDDLLHVLLEQQLF